MLKVNTFEVMHFELTYIMPSRQKLGAILENSIKKVQAYLFHSIPRCLCAQIAKSFINALTSWLKLSIKISTKLTNEHTGEFNDSMYVGLRLAEVIANNHVDHLDLSQASIFYLRASISF